MHLWPLIGEVKDRSPYSTYRRGCLTQASTPSFTRIAPPPGGALLRREGSREEDRDVGRADPRLVHAYSLAVTARTRIGRHGGCGRGPERVVATPYRSPGEVDFFGDPEEVWVVKQLPGWSWG